MKWFLPAAKDEEQASRIYQAIKDNLKDSDDRRISRITYHEPRAGKMHSAEVGKTLPLNGETVIAILHQRGGSLYYVCTANRGVVRGGAILVGEDEVSSFEDFDTE